MSLHAITILFPLSLFSLIWFKPVCDGISICTRMTPITHLYVLAALTSPFRTQYHTLGWNTWISICHIAHRNTRKNHFIGFQETSIEISQRLSHIYSNHVKTSVFFFSLSLFPRWPWIKGRWWKHWGKNPSRPASWRGKHTHITGTNNAICVKRRMCTLCLIQPLIRTHSRHVAWHNVVCLVIPAEWCVFNCNWEILISLYVNTSIIPVFTH